jgi:hypothetical protein
VEIGAAAARKSDSSFERAFDSSFERGFDGGFESAGRPPKGDAAALARAAALAKPVTLAGEQCLAVLPALHAVLPVGLRRGTVTAFTGPAATSMALAAAAGPTRAGSWLGVLGVSALGLVAAAELGVALERVVAVAAPPAADWGAVAATLLDAFDVVLVQPTPDLPAALVRRLQARARERGSVILSLAGHVGFSPDVVLATAAPSWCGLADGSGHLRGRQVQVESGGRGGAARRRRVTLWLPGPDGAVSQVASEAAVHLLPAQPPTPVRGQSVVGGASRPLVRSAR